MSYPPAPPLLLTKRLTLFLHQSLTPTVHTAALTSPSGKLLAHASSSPVAVLRTQCTVAASLWKLHAAAAGAVPDALPSAAPSRPSTPAAGTTPPPRPSSVTVQLSGGNLVVRRLKCGLLLVCVSHATEGDPASTAAAAPGSTTAVAESGGFSAGASASGGTSTVTGTGMGMGIAAGASAAAGGTSSVGTGSGTGTGAGSGGQVSPEQTPASPSEASSVLSAGAATTASYTSTSSVGAAGVVAVRRHAEDLARWLDDKLGTLRVPDDGIGME